MKPLRHSPTVSFYSPGIHREFAGNSSGIHREFIGNSPGINREFIGYSPGLAVFSCVAGNSIRREKTEDF
ncbi:hypothetical protein [Microcoleus sp.]|uniref:hypothetical protein n=1 Tax=Microcoleus sp. TaxID=44472 RepID=UPI0035234DE4